MPSLLLSSRISSGHTSGNWNCSRSISAQLAQNSSALSSLGIRIARRPIFRPTSSRSEEHTSELQSQSNLVCRLLLEKKKQHIGSVADGCEDIMLLREVQCGRMARCAQGTMVLGHELTSCACEPSLTCSSTLPLSHSD